MYVNKRMFILILFLIILFSNVIVFASGDNESDREKITILFWPGGPESDALQEVIDNYNANQGITDGVIAEILAFSRQGFFEKEKADLAAGSSDFDLNLVTTYSLGSFAPYLEPLDKYLTEEDTNNFIPSTLKSLSYNNVQYGIPTDVSIHFTYYRKDLIDQLLTDATWQTTYRDISEKYLGKALTPKEPSNWSWEDYIAVSLFFTQSINPDSPTEYGTVLQLKNLLFNIMIWQSTMVSNGGNWLDDSGNVIINSPEAKRGLEIYQTIIDNNATPSASLNYEFAEALESFKSGKVATMLQWNAAYSLLKNPEEAPLIFDKFDITALPAGSNGHKTHVHSLGFGMNANSKHKEAAVKFLKYFATLEAMQIYGKGGAPPVAAILENSTENMSFPILSSSLTDAYIVNGGTAEYALEVYTLQAEEFSAVWSGSQSIEQALENTEKRMKDIINK